MEEKTRILLECKERLSLDNNPPDGGGKTLVAPSFSDNEVSQKPVKKPTRQWAAWTREEEESFFTALRQVGKNFEKITCRVQSKNKDQVRHYYYRLVRRMNKLLGPGFCLDAKNPNDTNAAMLRWWSLLEKYGCKASKLHLKPRRFKIFIETLEHQLLEDRKKNARKRLGQGENYPSLPSDALSNQNKSSGCETRAVKFVLVDSQNIQKAGNGRGTSIRHNSNMGANQSRGNLSPKKAPRQRRKPGGTLSAAAVKKWEKAAIAGMSLVADAAEHLERTASDKEEAENHGALTSLSSQPSGCNNENSLGLTEQSPSHLPNFACNVPSEKSAKNTMKLKLQLFPIDDVTRRALEMDKHNPHLELTLSTRKKITSVLEHLNRKWGNSRAAGGDLMLFPYIAQRESLLGCQRWTQDSFVSAADVYAAIGNPPVFRLRYGWISTPKLQSSPSSIPLDNTAKQDLDKVNREQLCANPTAIPESLNDQLGRASSPDKDKESSTFCSPAVARSMADLPEDATGYVGIGPKNILFNPSGFEAAILWQRSQSQDGSVAQEMETKLVDQGVENISAQSAGEWADSLTNISVGDLLAEDGDANCVEPPPAGTSCCLEETPFSCDSFDAAIAAHISIYQNKTGFQSATVASCPSCSIWDAEETCDAFLFQNRSSTSDQVQNPPMACANIPRTSSADGINEDLPEEEEMADDTAEGEPMEEEEGPSKPCLLENSSKDFNALTDYWPDSLGPLDLDTLYSSRYYDHDTIFSDSLGGLSRLIASSLDAFQNCSFFLSEKKDASPSKLRGTHPSD